MDMYTTLRVGHELQARASGEEINQVQNGGKSWKKAEIHH